MMNMENEDNSTKKSQADMLKEEYKQKSDEDRLWEESEKEVEIIKEEAKEKEEEEKRGKKKDLEEYNKFIENQIFKENSFIRKAITEQEKYEEQQKIERDKKEKEKELQAKAEADYEKGKIRIVKAKIDEEIEDYKRKNDSSYNYFKFPYNDFKEEVYFFVKFKTKKDMIYIIENIKDESFNKFENDSEILKYYENKVINDLLINFYKLNAEEIYLVLENDDKFNEEINERMQREKRIQARSKKNKEERIEREAREERERIEREREELKQKREREKEQEREEKERIERENKRFINKLKRFFKLSK